MNETKQIRVAVIGAGERGVYVLGARTAELWKETGITVRLLCDTNPDRLMESKAYLESRYAESGLDLTIDTETDYLRIMDRDDIDVVFVTNYTSAHREPTVAALKAGKRVYLDKPMATSVDDARAMLEAEADSGRSIIMGFTRRYEHSWRTLVGLLRDGRIGTLQTVLLRSVIPYARYLQRWHRSQERSGGALNDKVSHYFDALNWIAESRPVSMNAIGGRSSVFAPDPSAPRRCRECDRHCPYRALPSPQVSEIGSVYRLDPDYRRQDVGIFTRPSWSLAESEDAQIDNCVYAGDTDIIDHALITVCYENGVKASLFWNIFGPSAEDEESIELVGSSGRMRLTRITGVIDIVSDYGESHEILDARGTHFNSSHFGADVELLHAIRHHYHGSEPAANTKDGFESLRMVLATEESIRRDGASISLISTTPTG
ncbi:MAG: Gfo/Idh/MocA family oxidoreductase [Spirochaetaceae bacterium]|nr:Gfo/Idh/MocA family oxidoreductase [Spirochaetaceae bacterium]